MNLNIWKTTNSSNFSDISSYKPEILLENSNKYFILVSYIST